ncbi:MAG: hypothetical protein QXL88_02710, partial [Candidatus Pacearchaeota archaeon]
MILIVCFEKFSKLEEELLENLKKNLSLTFKTKVKVVFSALPEVRKKEPFFSQFNAEDFLPSIGRIAEKEKADCALGITSLDLYVPGLNFVFGV